MSEAHRPADPLAPDLGCEHQVEPVLPELHRLVAQVDPALEQQFFDITQRQREPHVHHHDQPIHLRRGVEVAERAGRKGLRFARHGNGLGPAALV